jgi:hypothetical protein
MNEKQNIIIKQLYPSLNDADLKEAEENLEQYLAVILRIEQRLHQQQFEQ